MNQGWDEKVMVVLHRVPEIEEFEGGYEAVTMTGVPHNVIVTGSDRNSAEIALNHLVDGLRAFSFAGRVAIDDETDADPVGRYQLLVG